MAMWHGSTWSASGGVVKVRDGRFARRTAIPALRLTVVACATLACVTAPVMIPSDAADTATMPAPDAATDTVVDVLQPGPDCGARLADPPTGTCTDECFEQLGPALRLALDSTGVTPTPPTGSMPVRIGVFLTTSYHNSEPPWTAEQALALIRQFVLAADQILAQCSVHTQIEVAQVVSVPARLLDIQGNTEGSWGGHPPPGTPNPELFNYQQNERLTDETRELFTYGKVHASRNAISVFTVRHITYYAEQTLTAAGGLSFPPNNYHQVDDYPLRNSVLLVPRYPACGALPAVPGPRTLAHELGHMLLNSGDHPTDRTNLMSGVGTTLTVQQCATIRSNLIRLFGDAAVVDPGPPRP